MDIVDNNVIKRVEFFDSWIMFKRSLDPAYYIKFIKCVVVVHSNYWFELNTNTLHKNYFHSGEMQESIIFKTWKSGKRFLKRYVVCVFFRCFLSIILLTIWNMNTTFPEKKIVVKLCWHFNQLLSRTSQHNISRWWRLFFHKAMIQNIVWENDNIKCKTCFKSAFVVFSNSQLCFFKFIQGFDFFYLLRCAVRYVKNENDKHIFYWFAL